MKPLTGDGSASSVQPELFPLDLFSLSSEYANPSMLGLLRQGSGIDPSTTEEESRIKSQACSPASYGRFLGVNTYLFSI